MASNSTDYGLKFAVENAELLFERELLGWTYRPQQPIRTHFSLPSLVNEYIQKLKLDKDFTCPRPKPGDPEIVLAMNRLRPYYGGLYVEVSRRWNNVHQNR